MEKEINFS